MNVIPPLGVYAAMLRAQGRPLDYPGGAARVAQAVDVDLLARAIAWSGEADGRAERDLQRHQWRRLRLGEHLAGDRRRAGHEARRAVPLSLAQEYPKWIAPWDELRRKHGLISPGLEEFVGLSFQYADYTMGYGQTQPGPPAIVSTIKIKQAGFTEMMDTEAMFRKWFSLARSSRLLP